MTLTSSSAHLTLEEFTSSSSPLPTILVPRSQALRLVELCELAEMTPSASFLDSIMNNNGSDSPTTAASANGGASGTNHVLVTQMALLLYLGEYTHARHLWRRHRRAEPPLASESSSGSDSDYDQLEHLWNAAKYCYLWNTGGINSLTSSNIISTATTTDDDGSSTNNNNNNMQVDDNISLPFSTLALRTLQACQSSKMEPLATYSGELLGVFRSRVNLGLHKSFSKLDYDEFCLRMNLESGVEGESNVWESLGWIKEQGGYLVSDVDAVLDDDEAEDTMMAPEKEEDRIGKLTDIVMFLEGRVNA